MMGIRDRQKQTNDEIADALKKRKQQRAANGGPTVDENDMSTVPGKMALRQLVDQLESEVSNLRTELDAARSTDNAEAVTRLAQELDDANFKLSEYEEKLAQAEFDLLNTVPPGSVPMISIKALVEAPGRRRTLGKAAYQRLRDNIAKHGVQEPVKLRPINKSTFEIVSGHNRVAICRELGIELVPFVLDYGDDDKVDERAFWTNIAQSEPTAYELYIRLCGLRAKDPARFATNKALSDYTGVDETTVKQVMRMDDLPADAVSMLATAPDKLGANAVEDLAKIAVKGKGAQVTQAIEALLTQDGMTQQQAVRLAAATPAAPAKEKKGATLIKAGRAAFCSYRRVAKTVRTDFESEEDAAQFEALMEELLKRMAAEKRQK